MFGTVQVRLLSYRTVYIDLAIFNIGQLIRYLRNEREKLVLSFLSDLVGYRAW